MDDEKHKIEKTKEVFAKIGWVIGFVSGIFGIADFFSKDSQPLLDIIVMILVFLFITIISIVTICTFFSAKAIKKKSSEYYSEKYFGSMINGLSELHKFFHKLRNSTNEAVGKQRDTNPDNFKFTVKELCDYAEKVFDELLSSKCSVCIKFLETKCLFDDNIENWKIDTVVRGRNTESERSDAYSESTNVKDNSDFYIIVSDKNEDMFFSSPNMNNIYDEFYEKYNMDYKNSRDAVKKYDFLKYYKSTIVMPIKIRGKYVSENLDMPDKSKYHILGFLCIDSKDTFDGENFQKFMCAIEVAKSIADSIYNLLEGYLVNEQNEHIKEYKPGKKQVR